MKNKQSTYVPCLLMAAILLTFTACDVMNTGTNNQPTNKPLNWDRPCTEERLTHHSDFLFYESSTGNLLCEPVDFKRLPRYPEDEIIILN